MRVTEQSQAINSHQQHLVIIKEIGDRSLEAKVLKNLAELDQKLGQSDHALDYCKQALVIATELGIPLLAQCHKLKEELEKGGEQMKFEILTPLGFTVRTSESYWQRLIVKHPDIEELEELVQQALASPEEIRRSSRDADVLLFYLIRKEKRWVVAVTRRLQGDGFLITAYQTDAIKEGETIWLK